jgi:hypothetical protein
LTLAPNTVSGPIASLISCVEQIPVSTNATATVVVLNPIDAVDDNPVQ